MATVQAQFLSGRYRTQHLCSLWSAHTSEFCQLSMTCLNQPEDVNHILRNCEALLPTRQKMRQFSLKYSENIDSIKHLVIKYSDSEHPQFCQYLLVSYKIISLSSLNSRKKEKNLLQFSLTLFCVLRHGKRRKYLT